MFAIFLKNISSFQSKIFHLDVDLPCRPEQLGYPGPPDGGGDGLHRGLYGDQQLGQVAHRPGVLALLGQEKPVKKVDYFKLFFLFFSPYRND